nr:winged helix-turn-helix domain-containing protein [Alkalibaculum sporogenes]
MKVLHEENPLDLTPTEYNLLIYLIENKDRAISRDELLDEIWGYSKDVETRACDDTVRRIRKKLADSRVQVETIWGFGFTIKEENP